MRRRTGIFCSIVVIGLAFWLYLPGVRAQVRIIHTPVSFATAGEPILIEAEIEGSILPGDEMRVYYRPESENSYSYQILQASGNRFEGQIPAFPAHVQRIYYFLTFIRDEMIWTLPERNAYYEPLEIHLRPAEEAKAPAERIPADEQATPVGVSGNLTAEDYLILSPEQGETLAPDEVVIAVSLFFDSSRVDLSRTELYLDSYRVDPEISPNLISYVPPRVSSGQHHIRLQFYAPDGTPYPPIQWSFYVREVAAGGFAGLKVSRTGEGLLYVESKIERYSGNKLENHQFGGQYRGQVRFLRYGTKFYFTSLEDRRYQPRNRYLFWVATPIFRLYAGDTSPRFSDLILWGKRVRGIEAMLDLKYFALNVVSGQVNRAVEGSAVPDPNNPDPAAYRIDRPGTYTRNLLGLRARLGTEHGFHLAFNVLKAKDDVSSIRYGINPKDNLVLGADVFISLFANRFEWKTSTAISFLTDDISGGPLSKAEIDSLMETDIPIDPASYEKYLIINTSTIPLDPTTGASVAYASSLRLRFLRNELYIRYKNIGPAYTSLGNTYLKTDIRGLLINDRVRLWNNRLYLNLGYEAYKDHYSEKDNNPSVDLTTLRLGFSVYPGQGLPTFNVHFRSYTRNNGITELPPAGSSPVPGDPRERNTTTEWTSSASYDFWLAGARHTLTLGITAMNKEDAYGSTRPSGFIPIGIDNRIRTLTLRSRFGQKWTTLLRYAGNRNSYLGGWNTFRFSVLELRGSYMRPDQRLEAYAGFRQFDAAGGTSSSAANFIGRVVIDYKKNELDMGIRYRFWRSHQLVFDFSWIDYRENGGYYDSTSGNFVANPSYKDYMIRLRYEVRL